MVRKLSLAIAIALGVTPLSGNALGLGDINTRSALNQHFRADIELLSVAHEELEDVTVELASVTAFERAGVERPFFLSKLKFTPMQLPDGSTVIRVSSSEPIREPFLDFVIEVNWPKGRLLREYTVLLDPPVTLERKPAPVQQPSTRVTRSTRPQRPAATTSAPAAPDYSLADEGPITEYGPTRRNDTLWGIADKVRYRGTTMEQMMMSLFRENPHAFIGNNVNKLKRGEILRIPSRDQVMSLGSAEARAAFREQMNVWRADRAQASAAPAQEGAMEQVAQGPGSAADTQTMQPAAELKIASARPEGQGEAGPSESNEPSQVVSSLQQELVAAEEARESALAEGRELQSRVQDLESQLADMQRLLSLKSEQLATLQAAVVNGEEQAVAQTGEDMIAATDEEMVTAVDEEMIAATDEEVVAEADEETIAVSDEEMVTAVDEDMVAATDEEVVTATEEVVSSAEEDAAALMEEELVSVEEEELLVDSEPMALQEDGLTSGATEEMSLGDEMAQVGPGTTEAVDTLVESEESVTEVGVTPAEPEAAAVDATQTAVTEPVAEAVPAAVPKPAAPAKKSFLQRLTTDTTMMGIAVAVVVVLLALLWAVVSRRKSARAEFQESILVNTMEREESEQAMEGTEPVSQTTEETSFLSDFSPSDIDSLQDETGEVDPMAEADVYIAYGRYNQAEELIRQAIDKEPQRLELKQKLFEIMFATKDADGFTALAEEAAGEGMQQKDPAGWEKIVSMGMKLAPTAALFAAATAGGAEKSAPVEDDVVALEQELGSVEELDLENLASGNEGAEESLDSLDDLESLDLGDLAAEPEDQESADDGLDFDMDLAMDEAEQASEAPKSDEQDEDTVLDLQGIDEALEGDDLALGLGSAAIGSEQVETKVEQASESASSDGLELPDMDDELDLPVLDFGSDETEAKDDALELSAADEAVMELTASSDEPSAQLPDVDETDMNIGAEIDELMEESELVASLDEATTGSDELVAEEVNTKLDLARAYVDMGDSEGARSILDEVLGEGSDGQKEEAQQLLKALP